MNRIWQEILAFCFELDMPEIKPIILDDEDFKISFELPDIKTISEIRLLIVTFAVIATFDLHSKICWISIDKSHLRKRNYKQFIELINIVVAEKCIKVDNRMKE